LHVELLEPLQQQQVLDQGQLEPDLLALEVLDRLDPGTRDDLVVAVAVVGDQDHLALAAARTSHERVAVRHRDGVDLARTEGFHRRQVVEPRKLDVHAGFLEPALLDTDLERGPAGPIAVRDSQRCAGGRRAGCGARRVVGAAGGGSLVTRTGNGSEHE
jgi:hypothetical protein